MTKLTQEEILEERIRIMDDPVYFALKYLPQWFRIAPKDGSCAIPWFHRANLAIMARDCEFLEKYGDIDKIVEHFPKIFSLNEDGKLMMGYTQNTLLEIPRGFAKTTVTRAFILWSMVTRLRRVVLLISHASDHSKAECKEIRKTIEGSAEIKQIFGELVPERSDEVSRKWTGEELQLRNDATLITRSAGSQIRGLVRDGHRPDLIIIDDL